MICRAKQVIIPFMNNQIKYCLIHKTFSHDSFSKTINRINIKYYFYTWFLVIILT